MKKLFKQFKLGNPIKLTEKELRECISKSEFLVLKKRKIAQKIHLEEILCPECDNHTITVQQADNKQYFSYCTADDIGRITIKKEEVEGWQIDITSLLKEFNKTLRSKDEVIEILRGKMWKLGNLPINKNNYTVFFSPCLEGVSGEELNTILLQTKNPVILHIENSLKNINQNIQYVPITKIITTYTTNKGCSFHKEEMAFYFPEDEIYDASGDIILDERIILSPKRKLLLFGKMVNGKPESSQQISPQAVRIIEYLYKTRERENVSRTRQELANALCGGSRTSLRNRLKEIKDACTENHAKEITNFDPNNELRLNPKLTCIEKTH